MGMVDWSKPIEAVHESGAIKAASRLRSGPVWPDDSGQYHLDCEAGMFWNEDGSPWGDYGAWRIRNVGSEAEELATLRAFREQALARYPDLAEPESDEDAVERLVQNYYENDQMADDLVRDAIAWARANPR